MISVENDKYGVTNLKHYECTKNKLKHLIGESDGCKGWRSIMCRGGLIFLNLILMIVGISKLLLLFNEIYFGFETHSALHYVIMSH